MGAVEKGSISGGLTCSVVMGSRRFHLCCPHQGYSSLFRTVSVSSVGSAGSRNALLWGGRTPLFLFFYYLSVDFFFFLLVLSSSWANNVQHWLAIRLGTVLIQHHPRPKHLDWKRFLPWMDLRFWQIPSTAQQQCYRSQAESVVDELDWNARILSSDGVLEQGSLLNLHSGSLAIEL